jgi:hypothetical protein
MNAGGVSKACKSNGHNTVAIQGYVSGKRERNTLVTYLVLANNRWKRRLIRDIDKLTYVYLLKDLSVQERPMVHQVVGGVMAHQAYDGYQARERDLAHWD